MGPADGDRGGRRVAVLGPLVAQPGARAGERSEVAGGDPDPSAGPVAGDAVHVRMAPVPALLLAVVALGDAEGLGARVGPVPVPRRGRAERG